MSYVSGWLIACNSKLYFQSSIFSTDKVGRSSLWISISPTPIVRTLCSRYPSVLLLFIGIYSTAYASDITVTMRGVSGGEQISLFIGATEVTLSPSSKPISTSTSDYTVTGVTINGTIHVSFPVDNGDVYVEKIVVDGTTYPYSSATSNTGSWGSPNGCGFGTNTGWLYCNGAMSFAVPYGPTTVDSETTWHFDEASWTGTTGEVEDSVNGINGVAVSYNFALPTTESGSPVPAIAGDPGTCGAGKFDSNADGYVRIPDPVTGSRLDQGTHSLSAWVYAHALPSSDHWTILTKESNYEVHVNTSGQIVFQHNTTNPNAYWTGGWTSWFTLTSSSSISVGNWHHITITASHASSQKIYIDGTLAGTGTDNNSVVIDDYDLLIGSDHDSYMDSRSFNGYIDEVRVFDPELTSTEVTAVMNEVHACPPAAPSVSNIIVDVGGGNGSTCSESEIEITIQNSASNVVAGYTGTLTLSTSSGNGDWSKTATASDALGTLTPGSSDSGLATYVFEAGEGDAGIITLNLENTHAETITISAVDALASVTGVSSNLGFSENAFVVSNIDSLNDDIIAGRRHDFQVSMMRQDPSTGVCSVATGYSASAVKVWLNRTESAGAAPSLMNTDGSNSMTPPDSQPGSDNFTLEINSGTASFDMEASDIGQYSLQFLDDSNGFSDSDITGQSSSLSVRPFALYVDIASNPAAVDHLGNAFTTAGTDFTVTVKAVTWESADDAGDDGVADGHDDSDPANNADLSGNSVLNSFGGESTSEGVQLSSILLLPSGGLDGGLESSLTLPADARQLDSFSSGSQTTNNVFFDEVGIIELSASILDGGYLGSSYSSRIVGRSGRVGRFTPYEFSRGPSSINESCSSAIAYTYMAETFTVDYILNALSAQGSLTNNYENDYSKLKSGFGTLSFGGLDQLSATSLTPRISVGPSSFAWSNGVGSINTELTLTRSSSPDGPYSQSDIGLSVADSDSVPFAASEINLDVNGDLTDDHATLDRVNFRFGRLTMAPSHGPETTALPVKLLTEYWDGSLWQVNKDDNCTALALSDISFPDGTADVVANRTVTVGAGTSVGSFASLTGNDIIFSQGDAGHSFSAPGAGNTGRFDVDIDLSNYLWLRYDWNQDSDYSDSSLPTTTHIFGLYRGHDRIIYWREILH